MAKKSVTAATAAKPIVCVACGNKPFKNKRALGGHNRQVHYQRKEANPMSKEPCKDCQGKDTELATAATNLGQITQELEAKTTEAVDLQAELDKPRDSIPGMDEFIQHCTTCPDHGQQLQSYRQSVVNDVIGGLGKPESRDQVVDIMKAHGIEPAPDKFVISGLSIGSKRG